MGRRKYSYLFYKDGRKERILNWFDVYPYSENKRIVVFTQNEVYLYVDSVVDSFDIPEIEDISINMVFVKRPQYAFYKLRGGIHNIDVNNTNAWYEVGNIDRIEIVI